MTNYLNYVALDLETTGLDPFTCDIIEIAALKVRNGEIVDRLETLVYTPLEISEHTSYLTGLTTKHIQNAQDFIDLIPKIQSFIGKDPLVGHNIWFDWNFLVQKGVAIKENLLWDTYTMSNILYPQLPSHSLETNTKYFQIPHEDSHRAMGDALASNELWKKLMHTAIHLSLEQKKKIEQLKKKSFWTLLPFFLQPREDHYQYALPLSAITFYYPQHLATKDFTQIDHHLFIYAPSHDPVDTALRINTGKKTLFIAGCDHTLEKLQQIFPKAFRLFPFYSYLSSKKVDDVLKKFHLTDEETTLLLKTFLLPHATVKSELTLSHQERKVWRNIQIDEEEKNDIQSHYKKAYQKSLQAEKVITSHHHIFSDPHYGENFDRIIILEPHLLEDNATDQLEMIFFLDQWLEQSSETFWTKSGQYFFSQLNALGNKLVPISPYAEYILLSPAIIKSNEYIRLQSDIKSIISGTTEAKLLSYLEGYRMFFCSQDSSWIRWFTVHPKKGVSLNLAPFSVTQFIDQCLFQKTTCFVISNTATRFPFLPELPLISFESELKSERKYEVILPEISLIKGTKKTGDHQAQISFLAQELLKMKGKTGVIFSSKSILKRYFFDLIKVLPDRMLILGEDISGGTGKLQDLYITSNHNYKILFLTYRNLRNFPSEIFDFDQIFLQSLPFDPPSLPVYQIRASQYANPFESYSLPKAKQNFQEICATFTKRSKEKRLYLLDKRAQESSYGKEFISPFSE